MIDPTVWQGNHVERTIPDDHLVIGLTGSRTHYDDWHVLASVLPQILRENPHVHLIVGGFHPDYLANLPRTEYLPPLPYSSYAQVIKACDIVLAPVDPEDPFNDSKSELKAVEGMAAERRLGTKKAGAAVIATNNHVYQMAVKDGRRGLLVEHTPEAWYSAIRNLIQDDDLRQRFQVQGYNWVYQNRNITRGWRLWDRAYRDIMRVPK